MEIPKFQKKVHINCKKYIRSLKIKKIIFNLKGQEHDSVSNFWKFIF